MGTSHQLSFVELAYRAFAIDRSRDGVPNWHNGCAEGDSADQAVAYSLHRRVYYKQLPRWDSRWAQGTCRRLWRRPSCGVTACLHGCRRRSHPRSGCPPHSSSQSRPAVPTPAGVRRLTLPSIPAGHIWGRGIYGTPRRCSPMHRSLLFDNMFCRSDCVSFPHVVHRRRHGSR